MSTVRWARRLTAVLIAVLAALCVPAVAGALGAVTVGQNMDYVSFTQAVYETYDSGRDIIVYPGLYDIREEYEEFFGIAEINDSIELGHDFQYGVRLKERNVTFLPGAKLTCTWILPTDYSARFSPLYVTTNVTISGLDLYAEGTEYAIHDDVWRCDTPYINRYENCKVIGRRLYGANCLGGGVTKNTRIIIENCYFDNGADDSVTVRYHNTDYPDAEGEIWVSSSWFNGVFAATYYGETSHLDVFVNNCEARDFITKKETEDVEVENIDLFEWNNTRR